MDTKKRSETLEETTQRELEDIEKMGSYAGEEAILAFIKIFPSFRVSVYHRNGNLIHFPSETGTVERLINITSTT